MRVWLFLQRLELKSAREHAARRLLQHEKVLQEAAARGRVERAMGDLQAQLSALEGQLDARQDRVDSFVNTRELHKREGQRLSVHSALERAQVRIHGEAWALAMFASC